MASGNLRINSSFALRLQHKTVVANGTVVPDKGFDALSSVDVQVPASSTPVLESKTVKPTTQEQVITPSQSYDGLEKVTITAVDSSIDENIQPNNIKRDVNILGVTGTYAGVGTGGIAGGIDVTFESVDNDYMLMSVLKGTSIPAPVKPQRDGFSFFGWSTQKESDDLTTFPFTPEQDTTLFAQWHDCHIIGFTGLTNSSGELVYTDDIMNVGPYSTSDIGSYVTVTSKLDDYFPFSEIHEVTDDSGNVFISFPKCYIKWVLDSSGNIDGIKISDVRVDDSYFIPDCFLDPNDETAQTYLDETWIGKYEASGSASQIFSKSGQVCLANQTRATFRAAARSYGKGYQQLDLSQLVFYNFLCMLYYKTANIQTVCIGRTSPSPGFTVNTGFCDGVEGLNGWDTVTGCVKMLGVENPFGNIHKFVDGVVLGNSEIYIHKFPSQFSDIIDSAIMMPFSCPASEGYVKYIKPGTETTKSYAYPADINGSEGTYFSDYYFPSSNLCVLCCGGAAADGPSCGLWFFVGYANPQDSFSYIGGRLSRRPIDV